MTATQVRVLIADDEPLARERLRLLLGEHLHVQVVGEAENGEQVLRLCEQQQPDLVLLDIAMPGVDGLETARLLRQRPQPPAWCSAPPTTSTHCRPSMRPHWTT